MNFCLDIHGKTVFWILLHQSPKIRMNTKKKDTRHRHKRKIKIKKKPRHYLRVEALDWEALTKKIPAENASEKVK